MIYKIAIYDNKDHHIDILQKYILEFSNHQCIKSQIDIYHDGTEFLQASQRIDYDIIILEAQMQQLGGIVIAEHIYKTNNNSIIIFVSSCKGFLYEAAEVEALGYILKPIDKDKLFRILNRALVLINYHNKLMKCNNIEITNKYERVSIPLEQIVYMEKRRNKLSIYTKDEEYTCYITIKEMITKLDEKKFEQISSSVIVQWCYVKDINNYKAILETKLGIHELFVSRKYYQGVKSHFRGNNIIV